MHHVHVHATRTHIHRAPSHTHTHTPHTQMHLNALIHTHTHKLCWRTDQHSRPWGHEDRRGLTQKGRGRCSWEAPGAILDSPGHFWSPTDQPGVLSGPRSLLLAVWALEAHTSPAQQLSVACQHTLDPGAKVWGLCHVLSP